MNVKLAGPGGAFAAGNGASSLGWARLQLMLSNDRRTVVMPRPQHSDTSAAAVCLAPLKDRTTL